MLHEPAAQSGKDLAIDYKRSLGVRMLAIYTLVYAGFVIINVTVPSVMSTTIVFGLNLAVVYGFGLIFMALVLALIYDAMCRRQERLLNVETGDQQ